jgi:LmbE family N-acetylglucosaminyl deacetylase
MQLHNTSADLFVPGGGEWAGALKRTTHLGIGAHQDDLEIALVHGILECFGRPDRAFTGVTCTDGAGSARTGVYANYTNEDMMKVRLQEQRTAAQIGRYAAMLQLGYASKQVKDPADASLADDLVQILKATRPQVVYTHNPADKHATHVGVVASVIRALRRLPAAERPAKVLGCECWRGLDWLPDDRKVVLDVSAHPNLTAALLGVYDSQIAGGKRYDLAAVGRYRANATYLESHAVDATELAVYAMDLTPLIQDDRLSVSAYVTGLADAMKGQVAEQLKAVGL